jgi:hypothetical protein
VSARPIAKTAADWGRLLAMSAKAAAALFREAEALRAYGLSARWYRAGNKGTRMIEVSRIEAAL